MDEIKNSNTSNVIVDEEWCHEALSLCGVDKIDEPIQCEDLLEALRTDEKNGSADDIKTSNTSNVIDDGGRCLEVLSLCGVDKIDEPIQCENLLEALRTDVENGFADDIKTSNTSNVIDDEERLLEVLSFNSKGNNSIMYEQLLETVKTCAGKAKAIRKRKKVQR